MEKTAALGEIARMIGGDLSGAREYCLAIQKLYRPAPSFASIADSLSCFSPGKAAIQQVAELAGQIHLGLMVAVEIEEAEATAHPAENVEDDEGGTMTSPSHSIDEAILHATSDFVETISKHVLRTFFAGNIEGKVIGFTGSGPYHEADLDRLAAKLKAVPDREWIDWGDLEWVVIGSNDFDCEYLEQVATVPYLEFHSQEEFLSVLLFGESSMWPAASKELQRTHEGLRFVEDLVQKRRVHQRPEPSTPFSRVPSGTSTPVPPKVPDRSPDTPSPVHAESEFVTREFRPQPASMPNKPPEPPASSPIEVRAPDFHPPIPTLGKPGIPILPASPLFDVRATTNGKSGSTASPPPSKDAISFRTADPPIRFPEFPKVLSHEPNEVDASNLRMESELKQLGYSVKRGTIRTHRRLALQHGVDKLGLQDVINHLAWLIRFHRYKETMYDAVARWQEDLEWLKTVFRKHIR